MLKNAMFKHLNLLKEVYEEPFNAVTYNQHGYDDTVRFIWVDIILRSISYETFLRDISGWGLSVLTIGKDDYTLEPLEMAIWVVGGAAEIIMFNLKYKSNVIIELNHGQMMNAMQHARNRVANEGRIKWVGGVDYMNILGKVAVIKRAYNRYCKKPS